MKTSKVSPSLIWIIWACVFLQKGCYCIFAEEESRLIKALMKNYDSDARPMKNLSTPMKVKLKLIYKELKEMDEPKQAMSSITWFQILWKDESLRWDSMDYGGVSAISLDPSRIWKPDLTLYNSVHENGGDLYSFRTKPIVWSDGSVKWLSPAILRTSCKLDITKFPFDDQRCTMKIGSWTYDTSVVDLDFAGESVNLDSYCENTEWELVSATTKINTKLYPCCLQPYRDLTFTFHFRRKPWYYIISIVVPCMVLSLLASISFVFPAESGERVSLVISVLLGLTVFMLIINERTPVTSDSTPMVTRYFTGICGTTFAILLATAIVLSMHHATCSVPVPYYLAGCRDFFAFVLCMGHPVARKAAPLKDDLETMMLADDARLSLICNVLASKKTDTMEKILHELQRLSTRLEDEDFSLEIKADWQYTARVFNKMFFCVFLFVFLSLNIYVFSFLFF